MDAQERLDVLKRTVEELKAFNEIGKVLTSTLEIGEVLQLIMDKVGELLRPMNFSLLLVDEVAQELVFEIALGPGSESLKGMRLSLGDGIAGWVAREGQPVLVADAAKDSRFARRFDEATNFTTRSILAVPMKIKGRTLGLIELVNGPDQPAFAEQDLRLLGSIADYAAIALENARNFRRVKELTILDEHTGLFNARHLLQALDTELERARRFGRPLSLLFFDLDHFKLVNDRYGHQHGSALLRECAQVILAVIRTVDIATRYGGDEFVVVLPETDKRQALVCAEKLRQALSTRQFLAAQGLSVHLSASFGVATWPEDAQNMEELLRQADLAMYRVKESTRDGVQAAKGAPPALEGLPARVKRKTGEVPAVVQPIVPKGRRGGGPTD